MKTIISVVYSVVCFFFYIFLQARRARAPMLSLVLMRVRRCRASLLELVLLMASSFLVVLIIMHGKTSIGPAPPQSWVHALLSRKGPVEGAARGVLSNLPVKAAATGNASGNSSCPPGFYSPAELWPHLKRPVQDPQSPGAEGRAFTPGQLSGQQLREKLDGMARNYFNQFASDRISVHRSLGPDTRPPE